MKDNIMGCPYICNNKTSLGYCRTTACINPMYNGSGTYTIMVSDHTESNRDVYNGTKQDGGAE